MSSILSQVLLITDSLAFPRAMPEVVSYDETWVAILKRQFRDTDFVHCGRGGATIRELFQHSAYYHTTIQPALVLIQSGIVDCAPRALTLIEQQILQRVPLVGSPLTALARRHAPSLRRWRRISFTPLPTFKEYADRFDRTFGNVYWIGILPANPNYEIRVEGISEAILKYNAQLQNRRFIATDEFDHGDVMSDFHHLSAAGHRRLAAKLAEVIKRDAHAGATKPYPRAAA